MVYRSRIGGTIGIGHGDITNLIQRQLHFKPLRCALIHPRGRTVGTQIGNIPYNTIEDKFVN